MIDLLASYSHYHAHLRPIWDAIPYEMRGGVYATIPAQNWGRQHSAAAPRADLVLCAGYADARRARAPVVYVEHGAGQTYPGRRDSARDGSYSDGDGLDNVVLFLCPNEMVAARRRARYPNARVEVVGSAKLDPWHETVHRNTVRVRLPDPGVIGFAWHWPNDMCPEAGWAWPHYAAAFADVVAQLRRRDFAVVGHAHPRAIASIEPLYRSVGVTVVTVDELFDSASLLVVDNSSIGYEFASLDRPTVWCNAPTWRADVHHGLRFWDLVPGPQVDEPRQLVSAIAYADADPRELALERGRVNDRVFPLRDGHATERAVAAVVALLA
jgi:hypothetical protein